MNVNAAFSISWTDGDANIFTRVMQKIACPYTICNTGSLPVPAGLAAGAEIDIPFLGISTASFVCIENLSGQELGMAWGGNFSPNLPPGGTMLYLLPSLPVAGAINALRFFLTAAQVAAGKINYAFAGT